MKFAIYCRVSTSDQDNYIQKNILEKYAKEQKWKYKTYLEWESTRNARPVKQSVLTALREKKFDGILIYKLDRWARSSVELILEMKELTDKGITFISYTDNLDFSSASGKLHFAILSAFAEFERGLISERTRAALQAKKKTGVTLGRPKGSGDKKKRKKSGYYVRHHEEALRSHKQSSPK